MDRHPNDIILLYTTFPDQTTAEKICAALVQERLVACVNIHSPIKSMYWWKGQLENSNEISAYLKTTAEKFVPVRERLKALHPYEVPCLMEIPIDRVNPAYAQWLKTEILG